MGAGQVRGEVGAAAADPIIALIGLVGSSVRAWEPRAADSNMVVDRIIRQLRAVPGVYGAWLRAPEAQPDQPRSQPRERLPHDAEELAWPIGSGRTARLLAVHVLPQLDSDIARVALGTVAATLDAMLRWQAERDDSPLLPPDAAAELESLRRMCVQRGVLLENNRAVVLVIHADGSWYSVSAAFTRLLGYPRHVATTNPVLSYIHPEDRHAAQRGFDESFAGRSPTEPIDVRARTSDGRWVVLSVSFRDLTGEPGVDAVVAYCLDVTAQRAVERQWQIERARLAQLVHTLHTAVVVEDSVGRVAVANDAFGEMFDGAARNALGSDWAQVLADLADCFADSEYFSQLAKQLLADRQGPDRQPLIGQELAFADGRVIELDFAPIADDQTQLGALWHFRDVTERAAVQRGLEERNRSLAELAELRNVFVATVSHELRTPLTSVVSFSHLLQEEAATTLNPQQRQLLGGIDRNANRLLRLIEDLLLLVRLETHNLPLSFTDVEPPELVRAAVTDREPIAAEQGLQLLYDVAAGPLLHCDELRVHQVLGNLLSNAMKFTPSGGTVTVRAAPGDDGWRFEVEDTGIGIPAQDLDSMFASFSRASNASSQGVPGTGLGLVICQAIVARHGGTIALASTEGEGTRVTVRLPWRPTL